VLQRYVVNPRAFFTQLLILVSNILRTVFNAFQYVPVLIDGDTNNDVAAITTIASILAESSIDVNAVLLEGVGVRLRGMEQNLAASAGGLARAAGELMILCLLLVHCVCAALCVQAKVDENLVWLASSSPSQAMYCPFDISYLAFVQYPQICNGSVLDLCCAAADLSSNFGDTLSRLSPSLGAAFKSGADPIEAALEGLAASQQDQVTRYFRSQRFRAVSVYLHLRTFNCLLVALPLCCVSVCTGENARMCAQLILQ
jgi:hypothetical protein